MLIDYLSIKSQHGKRSLFFDPIHFEVTFVFEIPKSYSPKKKAMVLNKPYIGKVDVDNLLKKILDVCTGALYTNDNIVTSVSARKIYGLHAKTLFTVTNIV
jgi:Holliday junction resolvase RusA-like endonuclease